VERISKESDEFTERKMFELYLQRDRSNCTRAHVLKD